MVTNTLVDSYCKCRFIKAGRRVFDEIAERDSVTYNAMLMGYSKEGLNYEALELFEVMRGLGLKPSQFTFYAVLCAASGFGAAGLGRQVHGLVTKTNFGWNVFVCNSLMNFYSKCGQMFEARMLFDGMAERDNVSYNVMVSGYGWNEQREELLKLFREMQYCGFERKLFPFASLSSFAGASSHLGFGRQIHGQAIVAGAAPGDLVGNSLVDMYAKCGIMDTAEMIFSARSGSNTVWWTTMISGYTQNGLYEEALRMFCEMRRTGYRPRPDNFFKHPERFV